MFGLRLHEHHSYLIYWFWIIFGFGLQRGIPNVELWIISAFGIHRDMYWNCDCWIIVYLNINLCRLIAVMLPKAGGVNNNKMNDTSRTSLRGRGWCLSESIPGTMSTAVCKCARNGNGRWRSSVSDCHPFPVCISIVMLRARLHSPLLKWFPCFLAKGTCRAKWKWLHSGAKVW